MAIAGLLLLSTSSLCAGPAQLLSARDPAIALPAGANGDSVAPWISGDGRFVLFNSSASDLGPGVQANFVLSVFLNDRMSGTTVLVSANLNNTGCANGNSLAGQVSTNGRYAVFESDASNLVPGDTNGFGDVFVRDLPAGTNILVSVAADGGCANGISSGPVMTPDGRWIVFVSAATNLVAGDTNGLPDVFVRDLVSGTTTLVSVGAAGANSWMATPEITPDGRYIAFFSTATGMVSTVSSTTRGEIYLRDLVANQTTWVSTNVAATVNAILHLNPVPASHPALSDDGRYVAFKSGWTNGVVAPGGSGVAAVITFLFDAANGTNAIVSTNGFPPSIYSDDIYGPEITPDGRYIVFVEREAGPTTNSSVRRWDRQAGTDVLVSVDQGGSLPVNARSHTPAVSRDGRFVTFLSNGTNLVSNTISNGFHIYRRDLQTPATALVDVNANGAGPVDLSGNVPSLSGDGSRVVFSADGLMGPGEPNAAQVYLWDAAAGTNRLISARDPLVIPGSGNQLSTLGQISLSSDGRWMAFASYASDLVTNDFNGEGDVFVRDLAANRNILVSVGVDGNAALGGTSHSPALSADGRFVIFASWATNLVAGDTNALSDVFRRDLLSGVTERLSVNSNGVPLGSLDATAPVASQDGRYVAFLARTSATLTPLFWRDLNSGQTLMVAANALSSQALSMSTNGQRLAFFDNLPRLYVWDANALQPLIYSNTTASSIFTATLSPDGNRLLYQPQVLSALQLFLRDLPGASNALLYANTVAIRSSPWSADGRYFAFVTKSNLVADDSNGFKDVYLRDLQSGALTLVSVNQSGTASANGNSDSPVVSADGRLVVFRTFATDAAPGIVNPPSLVAFNTFTGSNTLLVTGTAGANLPAWVSRPVISRNGARIAFDSWDAVVSNDVNRTGDIFAGDVSLLPAADSDADGIPDWWTTQYFGHATGQAGDLSRAQDDADGDGQSNLAEFLSGTNPTDSGSVLVLHIATVSSDHVSLSWEAIPGRTYQVQSSASLSGPVWQAFPGMVVINGSQGSLVVPLADSQRCFRIVSSN